MFGKMFEWANLARVFGILGLTNGGTGASTASGARTNLDVYSKTEIDNKVTPSSNTETLSGNKTIAATDKQYHFLNPGGVARDITLPIGALGMLFVIKNTGSAGNSFTVKDNGGAAITNGLIANNVAKGFYHDGSSWQIV